MSNNNESTPQSNLLEALSTPPTPPPAPLYPDQVVTSNGTVVQLNE